jgi:hypothetical protein
VRSRGGRAETKLVRSQGFVPRFARHVKDSWRTTAGSESVFVCVVSDFNDARGMTGLTPDLQAEFGGELLKEGEGWE